MSLFVRHKEVKFGIGDKIRVIQKIKEGDKERSQTFEGILIAIDGSGEGKMITVRRLGVQQVGIERIFPIFSPTIEKVEVVKQGTRGTRRAKLYYIRDKSKREIDKIYSRNLQKSK